MTMPALWMTMMATVDFNLSGRPLIRRVFQSITTPGRGEGEMAVEFPEALKLAVCLDDQFEDTEGSIECSPAWVAGEVIFVDAECQCVVSGRKLSPAVRFRYFDLQDLHGALEFSKSISLPQ